MQDSPDNSIPGQLHHKAPFCICNAAGIKVASRRSVSYPDIASTLHLSPSRSLRLGGVIAAAHSGHYGQCSIDPRHYPAIFDGVGLLSLEWEMPALADVVPLPQVPEVSRRKLKMDI